MIGPSRRTAALSAEVSALRARLDASGVGHDTVPRARDARPSLARAQDECAWRSFHEHDADDDADARPTPARARLRLHASCGLRRRDDLEALEMADAMGGGGRVAPAVVEAEMERFAEEHAEVLLFTKLRLCDRWNAIAASGGSNDDALFEAARVGTALLRDEHRLAVEAGGRLKRAAGMRGPPSSCRIFPAELDLYVRWEAAQRDAHVPLRRTLHAVRAVGATATRSSLLLGVARGKEEESGEDKGYMRPRADEADLDRELERLRAECGITASAHLDRGHTLLDTVFRGFDALFEAQSAELNEGDRASVPGLWTHLAHAGRQTPPDEESRLEAAACRERLSRGGVPDPLLRHLDNLTGTRDLALARDALGRLAGRLADAAAAAAADTTAAAAAVAGRGRSARPSGSLVRSKFLLLLMLRTLRIRTLKIRQRSRLNFFQSARRRVTLDEHGLPFPDPSQFESKGSARLASGTGAPPGAAFGARRPQPPSCESGGGGGGGGTEATGRTRAEVGASFFLPEEYEDRGRAAALMACSGVERRSDRYALVPEPSLCGVHVSAPASCEAHPGCSCFASLVSVEAASGSRVVYQPADEEWARTQRDVVSVASACVRGTKAAGAESGAVLGRLECLMRVHELEARLQHAKFHLVSRLLECYEHAALPAERRSLARLVYDATDERAELSAAACASGVRLAYEAHTACLEEEAALLGETIRAQVDTERLLAQGRTAAADWRPHVRGLAPALAKAVRRAGAEGAARVSAGADCRSSAFAPWEVFPSAAAACQVLVEARSAAERACAPDLQGPAAPDGAVPARLRVRLAVARLSRQQAANTAATSSAAPAAAVGAAEVLAAVQCRAGPRPERGAPGEAYLSEFRAAAGAALEALFCLTALREATSECEALGSLLGCVVPPDAGLEERAAGAARWLVGQGDASEAPAHLEALRAAVLVRTAERQTLHAAVALDAVLAHAAERCPLPVPRRFARLGVREHLALSAGLRPPEGDSWTSAGAAAYARSVVSGLRLARSAVACAWECGRTRRVVAHLRGAASALFEPSEEPGRSTTAGASRSASALSHVFAGPAASFGPKQARAAVRRVPSVAELLQTLPHVVRRCRSLASQDGDEWLPWRKEWAAQTGGAGEPEAAASAESMELSVSVRRSALEVLRLCVSLQRLEDLPRFLTRPVEVADVEAMADGNEGSRSLREIPFRWSAEMDDASAERACARASRYLASAARGVRDGEAAAGLARLAVLLRAARDAVRVPVAHSLRFARACLPIGTAPAAESLWAAQDFFDSVVLPACSDAAAADRTSPAVLSPGARRAAPWLGVVERFEGSTAAYRAQISRVAAFLAHSLDAAEVRCRLRPRHAAMDIEALRDRLSGAARACDLARRALADGGRGAHHDRTGRTAEELRLCALAELADESLRGAAGAVPGTPVLDLARSPLFGALAGPTGSQVLLPSDEVAAAALLDALCGGVSPEAVAAVAAHLRDRTERARLLLERSALLALLGSPLAQGGDAGGSGGGSGGGREPGGSALTAGGDSRSSTRLSDTEAEAAEGASPAGAGLGQHPARYASHAARVGALGHLAARLRPHTVSAAGVRAAAAAAASSGGDGFVILEADTLRSSLNQLGRAAHTLSERRYADAVLGPVADCGRRCDGMVAAEAEWGAARADAAREAFEFTTAVSDRVLALTRERCESISVGVCPSAAGLDGAGIVGEGARTAHNLSALRGQLRERHRRLQLEQTREHFVELQGTRDEIRELEAELHRLTAPKRVGVSLQGSRAAAEAAIASGLHAFTLAGGGLGKAPGEDAAAAAVSAATAAPAEQQRVTAVQRRQNEFLVRYSDMKKRMRELADGGNDGGPAAAEGASDAPTLRHPDKYQRLFALQEAERAMMATILEKRGAVRHEQQRVEELKTRLRELAAQRGDLRRDITLGRQELSELESATRGLELARGPRGRAPPSASRTPTPFAAAVAAVPSKAPPAKAPAGEAATGVADVEGLRSALARQRAEKARLASVATSRGLASPRATAPAGAARRRDGRPPAVSGIQGGPPTSRLSASRRAVAASERAAALRRECDVLESAVSVLEGRARQAAAQPQQEEPSSLS